MKNKLSIFLILIIIGLTGCSTEEVEQEEVEVKSEIELISFADDNGNVVIEFCENNSVIVNFDYDFILDNMSLEINEDQEDFAKNAYASIEDMIGNNSHYEYSYYGDNKDNDIVVYSNMGISVLQFTYNPSEDYIVLNDYKYKEVLYE